MFLVIKLDRCINFKQIPHVNFNKLIAILKLKSKFLINSIQLLCFYH